MFENALKNFLIYLVMGFGLFFLFALIFIFYLLERKRGKEFSEEGLFKNLPTDLILLKISGDFKKEAENLIRVQIEKSYRELISSIFPEIRNSLLLNSEKFREELNLLIESAKNDTLGLKEMTETIYKDLVKENKKNIERISQSFLLEAKEKLNFISKKIEREEEKIFQEIKFDLNKKMAEIENFLEEKKRERIREIEKNIYKILNDVAKRTLGKTVDLSTHEELVMKALEKAKKENFFKI